ncbi:hypothetical protein Sjap_014901 [Stephania japonica]|uniref:Protein kinase domain-containing protein n=1 Tax=Stephania japonica TaxID=461633 RepID=A0AAP0II54_9MAGN
MNTQTPFFFSLKNFISLAFLLLLLLLVPPKVVSNDPKFEACRGAFNCGSGLKIRYPFWVQGHQEPYCGFPGFNISCKNSKPVLKISSNDYAIVDIDYHKQSLRVSNFESFSSNCTIPIVSHNLTFNQTPFKLGVDNVDLFLFSNCSAPFSNETLAYSINCSRNNSSGNRRSFALFDKDKALSYVNQSGKCDSLVIAPVDSSWSRNISGNDNRDYKFVTAVLNKGFQLTWKASRCEVCNNSGGICGFDYKMFNFMCFCPDRPHWKECRGEELPIGKKLAIGLGSGVGGAFLTCLAFVFILIRKRRLSSAATCFWGNILSDSTSKTDLESSSTSYYGVHVFSYAELKEATNNFDVSRELGDGGFGTVYHGKIQDGRSVAVKRMYEYNYKRFEQFKNEIKILAQLRHQNLVSLYGCTSYQSHELLLVYEFIPNGTVADHLHGERSRTGLLTWPIRMRISVETANALSYLHASDIIHRDVKTNNILLDCNFSVKVADFGLSRPFPTDVTHISTAPQGTPGYVDPKYYHCYQLTNKSDVYSFGVVLFELISSKPAVDISRHQHEINLSTMAINKIQNGALHELVDPSLGFESDSNTRRMITLVAELAFRCLQPEKEMRPSMDEVLEVLKGIESNGYKIEKQVEMDVPADDISLLDNTQLLSPDLTTDKSVGIPTSPDTIVDSKSLSFS